MFGPDFMRAMFKIISTAGFSIATALLMSVLYPFETADRGITLIVKLSIISLATLSVHLLVSWLLQLEEARPVTEKIKRLILRPVKIQ
jgi:hypothetical protein